MCLHFCNISTSWKEDLYISVYSNDTSNFNQLLSKPKVLREIKEVDEWRHSESPIDIAIALGRNGMLTMMLNAGANPNAILRSQGFEFRPLHKAVFWDNLFAIDLLIRHGADENFVGVWSKC